jgi:hypothetical protein
MAAPDYHYPADHRHLYCQHSLAAFRLADDIPEPFLFPDHPRVCVLREAGGFVFSELLACSYFVLMVIFSNDPVVLKGALIRVLIFIPVAGVITYLSLIRIRMEDALKESNKRFFEFLKEAAMRLKTPLEVVEENISGITSDIERGGCDPADVALQLKFQMKNMEQIRQTIIELNKAITDHGDEFSDATRKFLME